MLSLPRLSSFLLFGILKILFSFLLLPTNFLSISPLLPLLLFFLLSLPSYFYTSFPDHLFFYFSSIFPFTINLDPRISNFYIFSFLSLSSLTHLYIISCSFFFSYDKSFSMNTLLLLFLLIVTSFMSLSSNVVIITFPLTLQFLTFIIASVVFYINPSTHFLSNSFFLF